MSPLDPKDIESELSYAYLHAVASKIACNCVVTNRHQDNRGIDAQLTCWEQFEGSYKEEIDLKVQLKATLKKPVEKNSHFSYFFKGIKQYDFLREKTHNQHRVLVVLFLPDEPEKWLKVNSDKLVLKNSAYWISLRGAGKSINNTGETIYLPKTQLLTPENLRCIFKKISLNQSLNGLTP